MKKFSLFLLATSIISINAYAHQTGQDIAMNQTQDPSTTQSTQDPSTDKGQAFLNTNKTKPGIVTLADGLQYKILKKGKGPKPTDTDIVTVNYEGTLIDGTEFDSSYKRGEPASFPVGGVIPGWTEALKLMPVGSTWQLYIPADLAYGENGAPPSIGPNETLIFKVELISINQS